MASGALEETNAPVRSPAQGSAWRGVLVGLIPLFLLLVVTIATLLVTTLVRVLTTSSGFFVEQRSAAISLIAGLVLATIVYASALVVTLRRIKGWQQNGAMTQARAALLALGVTAVIVALPVILAIVLPQHPAL
jgi:hypothetical protein